MVLVPRPYQAAQLVYSWLSPSYVLAQARTVNPVTNNGPCDRMEARSVEASQERFSNEPCYVVPTRLG